jgi:hypothetical protein
MTDRHILIAFMATLTAIVVLVITGAIIAVNGYSAEALGIGGAVTGLIGVIGTFKPRTAQSGATQDVNVVNAPESPIPVTDEGKA